MTDMATITVHGFATVPGTPDEAVVSFELRALRPAADEAYADVAERSGRFDALCEALDIPRSARSTQGISVREKREHDGTAWRHRGYVASNRVLARMSDPQLVATLMKDAVASVQAQVAGPWWKVEPTNPARAEACRLAAAEARRKAEAYADALGVRLGAIVDVREPDWRGREWAELGRPLAFESLDSGGDAEIPVHAGNLDVSAAVDVTFAVEHS
jgi:uncharacterized protein